MEYINLYGLFMILLVLLPNLIYGLYISGKPVPKEKHRILGPIEQIGRIGCVAFMALEIPGVYFDYWSQTAFLLYLSIGFTLVFAYCLFWIIFWKKGSMVRALLLSILPSLLFLSCGIFSRSILLIVFALIFAPAHIAISCMDAAKWEQ